MLKLYAAAEKAKQTLSPVGVNKARINLKCLMDDLDFNVSLRADEYKAMCEPLLASLAGPIERALSESKLDPANLSSVEIVGGATHVGSVKEALSGILCQQGCREGVRPPERHTLAKVQGPAVRGHREPGLPHQDRVGRLVAQGGDGGQRQRPEHHANEFGHHVRKRVQLPDR